MRSLPLLLLLLLPASAIAAERTPPPSATNLVRYRPAAWRLPAPTLRAGMRVEPESGETNATAMPFGRGATTAALRESAAVTAHTNADGSRHAVLGAAFRSWTVVHLDPDGRLVSDCVDDLETATRRVEQARKVPR